VAIGVLLTAVNLYGLRAGAAQHVPEEPFTPRPGERAWLTGSLKQRHGEADEAYFRRVTMSMHYRIKHSDKKYVVPLHENWLLYGARFVVPSYRDYEYADYGRALERGAGLCTQYVAAIFDLLKRQGIKRSAVEFGPHTVLEAEASDGRKYILDADFGVLIPRSIAQLRRDPRLARRYYGALDPSRTPYRSSPKTQLAAVGERAYSDPPQVFTEDATPDRAQAERLAYALKWPLPIALFVAGAALLGWRRPARQHALA
jgi:hypothetical protein